MKRKDYISWDEYFMGIALLSSQRSKDPNTQVGACIVNEDKRIVAVGYNGMPNGCDDDAMPWVRESTRQLSTKYFYVCHAELNAILNSARDLKGCTLYVTLFPCSECAKAIIQAGIKRVVFYDDKYKGSQSELASIRMFDKVGIQYERYQRNGKKLTVSV